MFRLFLLIPCWESQRLIPKRSAGPRATKIGVVSLKALDHHRPNREESLFTTLEAITGKDYAEEALSVVHSLNLRSALGIFF